MNIFNLVGSIMVDSSDADNSLQRTDENAQTVGKSFIKTVGTAAKWGIGIALAAGTAAMAVVGLSVNIGEDLKKALNGLQAETGATDESMAGMKNTMLAIYNNNFGEDFADIGKAMAEVGKQTGATGKQLQSMTEDALALRDTFEYEVGDSTKAATMMMNQFGISGKDSFNLIAQGAQQGLDKNGDLLDSINEYSTNFKMAGLSSEDMFNMFKNGAAGGVISSDKIGDAIKEFGIRSKDMSKGTTEAFKTLGLNANKTSMEFAKGGATGKKAYEEVNKKLFEMKDPLEQNAIGTALYGSMWEDVGAKGIKALSNMKGSISTSTDALTKINAVKYNTIGEAMQGIKRNLETGVLLPISDKILPILSKFSTWFIANLPTIKQNVSTAMSIIGTAIDKVKNAIQGVSDGIGIGIDWIKKYSDILIPLGLGIGAAALAFGIYTLAISAYTLATSIATGATGAFGTVMAFITSPIGIVILAIGALIGIFVLAYNNIEGFRNLIDVAWSFIQTKTKEIFEGYIMPFIRDTLMPLFQKVFSTIGDVVKGAFTLMGWAWNYVLKPVFMVLMFYIQNIMVPAWKLAFSIIGGAVKSVFSTIGNLWNKSLKPIFNGMLDFISGVFTGNWKKAWSGVVNVFKGVWEGMKAIAKAPINFIIGGLNGFIAGINKIKIPDWVPKMGGMGINIPRIPSFAVGTDSLPYDMLINAHKGEMITPAKNNPHSNKYTGDKSKDNNKQPMIIQLVLQNGKAISEFLIDDINKLIGNTNLVAGRNNGL